MSTYKSAIGPEAPILHLQVEDIRSWAEWLSLWDNASTCAQYIGLLHSGFDVPIGPSAWSDDAVARLQHYLAYADRWYAYPQDFRREEEPYESDGHDDERRRRNRKDVSVKAFRMVTQHVLRPAITGDRWDRLRQMSLEQLALSPAFPHLLAFFEPVYPYKTSQAHIGNLGYVHNDVHATWARQALLALCRYGLGLDARDTITWPTDGYREKYGTILMQILAGLGELNLLLDEGKQAPLAGSSWTALRELALRQYSPQSAPATLQGNIAAGYPAASVYLTLGLRRGEIAINI